MAYGVEYYIVQKDATDTSSETVRIELLKKDFSGSETELKARGDIFTHEYEKINPREPFRSPIQDSRLELHLNVGSDSEQDILDTIFDSDEEEYRLRKKVGGSAVWTGKVLSDLLEYAERDYPYQGTIIAKDLSSLSGSFGLQLGQEKIITTIADILNNLGYGIDIHTFTNWENSNDTSDDYLNIINHLLGSIRDFANFDGESDSSITNREALNRILRSHNLILRQSNNAWNLYHISALQSPSSVTRYVYDSSGTQQSSGSVDLTNTIDNSSTFYLPATSNIAIKAIKKAKVRYNHRTPISTLKLPASWTLQRADGDKTFSQDGFVSDGTQALEFSAAVLAEESTGTEAIVAVNLKVDDQFWDGSAWGTSDVDVEIDLTDAGGDLWTSGSVFTIITGNIPAGADGAMEVTLRRAQTNPDDPGGDFAETTWWKEIDFKVLNPSVEEGDSTAIINELEQSGNFSPIYDHGDSWFGDGPTSYSPGRLRLTASDTDGEWRFVGEADEWDFHQLALKEMMVWQRSHVRTLRSELRGAYSPHEVAVHDSTNFFFIGGTHVGRQGHWFADFAKIQFSDATDTFTQSFQTSGAGTGSGGSGGTSSTSGDFQPKDSALTDISGLSVADGNFIVGDGSNFVAESGATARASLGLADQSADLDLNAISINGTNLFPDNDPQALGTGDSPTFEALDVNGNILASGSITAQGNQTVWHEGNLHYAYSLTDSSSSPSSDLSGVTNDSFYFAERVRNATGYPESFGSVFGYKDLNNGYGYSWQAFAGPDATDGFWFRQSNTSDTWQSWKEFAFHGDNVSFGTGTFSGALSADTLRPDTGKFLSPVSYQFRNAGDTGFRDVEMAGLTATTGTFSGDVDISGSDLVIHGGSANNSEHQGMKFYTDVSSRFAEFRTWRGGSSNQTGININTYNSGSVNAGRWNPDGDLSLFNNLTVAGTGTFSGLLTAQGGIEITSGNLAVNKTGATEALDVNGNLAISGTATFGDDVTAQENLFVEGGLFAKEFTVDTTRVFLSGAFDSGGVVGEIVDATVGSEQIKFVDQDGNAIVPFADDDLLLIQQRTGVDSGTIVKQIKRKVVADSQPSNVVSLTTSGVTTGTDTGTIAVGDQSVKRGNTTDSDRDDTITIDVLDRPVGAFGFWDGRTDFGAGTEVMRVGGMDPGGSNEYSSDLTGDIGIAGKIGGSLAFALTEDEGLIADFQFEVDSGVGHLFREDGDGNFIGLQSASASSTKAFFAGASDKTGKDAPYSVTNEGFLNYAGIRQVLDAGKSRAAYDTGGEADELVDRHFQTGAVRIATGKNTNTERKLIVNYLHEFGVSKIVLDCLVTIEDDGYADANYAHEATLSGMGESDVKTITSSGRRTFEITVPGTVSVGDDNDIVLTLEAEVEVLVDDGDPHEAFTKVRNDYWLVASS